jgi:hypothetical protein
MQQNIGYKGNLPREYQNLYIATRVRSASLDNIFICYVKTENFLENFPFTKISAAYSCLTYKTSRNCWLYSGNFESYIKIVRLAG